MVDATLELYSVSILDLALAVAWVWKKAIWVCWRVASCVVAPVMGTRPGNLAVLICTI
jgi:hypothetical protein